MGACFLVCVFFHFPIESLEDLDLGVMIQQLDCIVCVYRRLPTLPNCGYNAMMLNLSLPLTHAQKRVTDRFFHPL